MKSATLLAKDASFIYCFAVQLRNYCIDNSYDTNDAEYKIEKDYGITTTDNKRLLFYSSGQIIDDDCREYDEHYEYLTERGYVYDFQVECRHNDLFCDVIKYAAKKCDFIVIDTNGVLFQPDEVDPDIIVL